MSRTTVVIGIDVFLVINSHPFSESLYLPGYNYNKVPVCMVDPEPLWLGNWIDLALHGLFEKLAASGKFIGVP
jgi:hypothetical protein